MDLPKNIDLINNLLSEKYLSSADLNTLLNPGFYFVEDGQNGPLTAYAHVIVSSGGDNRVMQIYLPDQTTDDAMYLYYRQKVDTTWSSWRKVARDDGGKYLSMHNSYTGDLNDLRNPGLYYVPANNAGIHAPSSGNWGHVLVSSSGDSGSTAQLWLDDNTNNNGPHLCLRVFNFTWTEWKSFVTMDDVTAEVTRILTTAEF